MRHLPWLKDFNRLAHRRVFWSTIACLAFGIAAIASWRRDRTSFESAMYLLLFTLSAYEPVIALIRVLRNRKPKADRL